MNSDSKVSTPLYGAIEAGGTKFVCSIAHDFDSVVVEELIATGTPQETFKEVCAFLSVSQERFGRLSGIGIAAFGPIDLDVRSVNFGRLRVTPKAGWSHASFIEPIQHLQLECPIAIDTDVNAAAMAEVALGSARGCDTAVYVTVGTGIGGGAVVRGQSLRGTLHPEMGHIHVRRHRLDTVFTGICPFHDDCLEGLACGPAILARWGKPLSDFDKRHESHRIIGHYLGQMAATIALMIAPQRIVFGGGVMNSSHVLPWIRASMEEMLSGYHQSTDSFGSIEELVCLTELDGRAGVLGALMLAKSAAAKRAALLRTSGALDSVNDARRR